jgi:hypothetical protein
LYRRRFGRKFFAEFELDSGVGDVRDTAAMKNSVGDDIEFLSNTGPQDAGEMIGVCAGECGTVRGHFIGNPSATSHASPESLVVSPDGGDRVPRTLLSMSSLFRPFGALVLNQRPYPQLVPKGLFSRRFAALVPVFLCLLKSELTGRCLSLSRSEI